MANMKHYIQTNNLNNYRDINFTGYFRMSDSDTPSQVKGNFTLPETGKNPFVIEAGLYADDGSVSISIEHIDGKYLIGIVNWQEMDASVVLETQTYLTHGLEKIRDAKFVRAWIPVPDPQCAGMEVLQPAWRAFVGFDTMPVEIKKLLTTIKD